MAKICKRCKTEFLDADIRKNFYSRGRDKHGNQCIDGVCKFCRRAEAKTYFANHGYGARVAKQKKPKKFDSLRRETKEGFLKYMTLNPFYFKEIFKKEPTEENMVEEFKGLNR